MKEILFKLLDEINLKIIALFDFVRNFSWIKYKNFLPKYLLCFLILNSIVFADINLPSLERKEEVIEAYRVLRTIKRQKVVIGIRVYTHSFDFLLSEDEFFNNLMNSKVKISYSPIFKVVKKVTNVKGKNLYIVSMYQSVIIYFFYFSIAYNLFCLLIVLFLKVDKEIVMAFYISNAFFAIFNFFFFNYFS